MNPDGRTLTHVSGDEPMENNSNRGEASFYSLISIALTFLLYTLLGFLVLGRIDNVDGRMEIFMNTWHLRIITEHPIISIPIIASFCLGVFMCGHCSFYYNFPSFFLESFVCGVFTSAFTMSVLFVSHKSISFIIDLTQAHFVWG